MITLAQFLIAKCAITTTYATIYTFTPELFPTVIRNTAMGVCSMMARFGAILASFISLWLVMAKIKLHECVFYVLQNINLKHKTEHYTSFSKFLKCLLT